MALADYLAKNYLTADGPAKPSKKRKRKHPEPDPSANTGLTLSLDDPSEDPFAKTANASDDDENPTVVTGKVSGATGRKKKLQGWKTFGNAAPSNTEQAEADRILAAAEEESRKRREADEEEDAPQIVEDVGGSADGRTMANGATAGLQTAAEVGRALEKKAREERKRFEQEGSAVTGKGSETIYRDASGRIVNVAMKRAEARRKAEEEERKKAEELEAMKGDVQRREKEERMKNLAGAKLLNVARHADDEEMNEELKERERWDDPALAFLVRKKERKSKSGKPLYQGSSQPNRYGIRPGHRWDGVDRSNGFEKEYFAAQNRRQDMKNLEYAWQMDE